MRKEASDAQEAPHGRAFRVLTLIDEYTRECLSMDVARRVNHQKVLDRLSEQFLQRGVPQYLRLDK